MSRGQNGSLLKDLRFRLDIGEPGSTEYFRNYQYLKRMSRNMSLPELERHAAEKFGKHNKR